MSRGGGNNGQLTPFAGGGSSMKKGGSTFGSSAIRKTGAARREHAMENVMDNNELGLTNEIEFPYMSYILPAQVT